MTHDDADGKWYSDRTASAEASNATSTRTGEDGPVAVSRRRLLAAGGVAALAGLAGCSGGGSSVNNVVNEVEGITVTGSSSEVVGGDYRVTVVMTNSGGEDVEVFDFDYELSLYDDSGSEIQVLGKSTEEHEPFAGDGRGVAEIEPTIRAEPSSVVTYQVRIVCEEGPYCE